uniref:Uncharacterized protein n=1 Tax=Pseudopediastrum sp. CL0201VA TaxID=2184484 RepID=A0A2U8GKB3_9CHLO|nr:hypothetical protein [Pseudopediastrum sp. CL0201VA]YP_009492297.1 hypothetical protein [Pseudopediastrum sp. CL0201VA]AWI68908.1 hypothetical protein [Pseudopediastrum sp. CL0201VA]AWI68909.1 hypothetical protein [Pseudopediastrum sp. CL0201VA]
MNCKKAIFSYKIKDNKLICSVAVMLYIGKFYLSFFCLFRYGIAKPIISDYRLHQSSIDDSEIDERSKLFRLRRLQVGKFTEVLENDNSSKIPKLAELISLFYNQSQNVQRLDASHLYKTPSFVFGNMVSVFLKIA